MNLNKIFKKRKSGLTLVVATTLLFAAPMAAQAATTDTNGAANNTDANSASADGNNGIVGTEPGASTATGGIKIVKTDVKGRYGDKYSVNATLDIRVDYAGDKVEKGATFSVGLGDGLQVPNGFNSVDLKATALDGSEKKIGKCTAENGAFNCVVTEDIAQTLGGNGSLKNGFVKLEATLNKSSIGKTTTNVVVDGTKYTVGLGKGVVGEPVTPGDNKFCWADGRTAEGLNKFGCWIQAQGQPGQTITITETRDDATFQGGIHVTPVDHGDWANPIDWNNIGVTKPKVTKSADGKSATFTLPSELSGDHMARIRVEVVTSEKEMTNKATVNNKEVTTTVTWRAKGSSGAETGEDEKPVTPTPAPTPEPEPSTPPVTPEPEKPAPTPDPTPDTPKPDPKPTPEQPTPNPDPKPTPEPSVPPVTPPAPTPEPEPSQPSTPEKPKPEPSKPSEPTDPAPTPDPKPSGPSVTPPAPTPEKPKPEKPAEKPEPKETPKETPAPKETPSQPSKQTPPAPSTPDKPGNSTTEHKGAITGLAQTGASDMGLMIAGATALVTAGGIALLLRRRQNNN
jgi:LPXTG-motif cell wall-anchored protein